MNTWPWAFPDDGVPPDIYDTFWEWDPSLPRDDPVYAECWTAFRDACERRGIDAEMIREQAPACETMYEQLKAEFAKPLLRRVMERVA